MLERLQKDVARPSGAWPQILGADWGSVEFSRRHAEVVGLYTGTLAQVAAFPDRARERAERYAWGWWLAIVAPDHGWGSNMQSSQTVDTNALDQLGSVADLIDSRMAGSLAAPDKSDLTDLRAVCQEWADAVLAETDLAEALKSNLLQDLRHLTWLIDNADLFGVARVAASAETVVGTIITTSEALPDVKHGEWLARGKKFLAAVIMLGGLYQGLDVGWMLASGAGDFIAELTAGTSAGDPSAPGSVVAPDRDTA